jgi:hypothetical protein
MKLRQEIGLLELVSLESSIDFFDGGLKWLIGGSMAMRTRFLEMI